MVNTPTNPIPPHLYRHFRQGASASGSQPSGGLPKGVPFRSLSFFSYFFFGGEGVCCPVWEPSPSPDPRLSSSTPPCHLAPRPAPQRSPHGERKKSFPLSLLSRDRRAGRWAWPGQRLPRPRPQGLFAPPPSSVNGGRKKRGQLGGARLLLHRDRRRRRRRRRSASRECPQLVELTAT